MTNSELWYTQIEFDHDDQELASPWLVRLWRQVRYCASDGWSGELDRQGSRSLRILHVLWHVFDVRLHPAVGQAVAPSNRQRFSKGILFWYFGNITWNAYELTSGDLGRLGNVINDGHDVMRLLQLPKINLPGWGDVILVTLVVLMTIWAIQPDRRR